jgi:hypothetical protein
MLFLRSPQAETLHLRLTQTGWQTGKEWDAAYEYLAAGNAQLLGMLHHRFVAGPTDWQNNNLTTTLQLSIPDNRQNTRQLPSALAVIHFEIAGSQAAKGNSNT